jgi:hypothetical protein
LKYQIIWDLPLQNQEKSTGLLCGLMFHLKYSDYCYRSDNSKAEGCETVVLTTAPGQPKTHWKQTMIMLPDGIARQLHIIKYLESD